MVNFDKGDGLVPAIIQDASNFQVLMLGYMNEEALQKTRDEGIVTFYSRSKQRLWMKGETSGNTLTVKNIFEDCDNDALLIMAEPTGPVCHTGTRSCFADDTLEDIRFLPELERIIAERIEEGDEENSYTARLYAKGLKKMAQKVGEEGVEVAIAAVAEDEGSFKEEVCDLLFHLLVILKEKHISTKAICGMLANRNS